MGLAEFEKDGWQLDSGEERHARSPEIFWVPDRIERDTLPVGAGVKLIFQVILPEGDSEEEITNERM